MISVIVPIYNVENYLPKCLDSLKVQTFSDVEFILVDDGSTDRSGNIADQYKSRDSRFRVFHTRNRGLSAARNFGIEKANGEWIMFVDGDDRVSPDFCRIPYEAAVQYEADLVIFRTYYVKKRRIEKQNTDFPVGVISHETSIDCGRNAAWNKLYRRSLFDTIRYPEGKVFEDIATTYRLIYAANRIAFIREFLYYYVNRKNSISNIVTIQNETDHFSATSQRFEDLIKLGYPEEKAVWFIWPATITFLVRMEPSDDSLYQKAAAIADSIPGLPEKLGIKQRFMLLLWKKNRNLFQLVCRAMGRKVKEKKKTKQNV